MSGFDILTLISETFTVDELGQRVPAENRREVFCQMKSVSQSEFFGAGQLGLKPEYKAVMTTPLDYGGEEIAEYEGERYAVYRTYAPDGGQLELYLKREAGRR